ncbi:MAG: Yop proteins translocation protein U [Chlamydiia bacterium]|nr:Yop proteins translocation protein U [Chlamydiia bacterium]
MAEKTEKATPKKLKDARKKGQVAKSQDFSSAFTFIVSVSTILLSSTFFYNHFSTYLIQTFQRIRPNLDMQSQGGMFMLEAIQEIFSVSLPVMGMVSAVGVLVSFLVVGPVFSMEAMKPDIKKLNPVTNLRNMFKVKTFFELAKSIFKITGALVVIYFVVRGSIDQLVSTAAMPVVGAAVVFSKFLIEVVVKVGIFFIVVGVADLIFQKQNFAKEMKMEKFEVKQEFKDSEGNPEIKSKRRQTAQEIAYQEGPRAAKRAKAIITNPSHIAVAIEYHAEEEPAPKILTMGMDFVAEEIVKVGLANNVPIMRNVELAQTLFFRGTVSDYVPEETYQAIAEILKWIASLEEEEKEYNVELFT